MKRTRGLHRDMIGASAIEAVLVIPLLVIASLLVYDVLIALSVRVAVNRVSYEAARRIANSELSVTYDGTNGGSVCSVEMDTNYEPHCHYFNAPNSSPPPGHSNAHQIITELLERDALLNDRPVGFSTSLEDNGGALNVVRVVVATKYPFIFRNGWLYGLTDIYLRDEYELAYLRN